MSKSTSKAQTPTITSKFAELIVRAKDSGTRESFAQELEGFDIKALKDAIGKGAKSPSIQSALLDLFKKISTDPKEVKRCLGIVEIYLGVASRDHNFVAAYSKHAQNLRTVGIKEKEKFEQLLIRRDEALPLGLQRAISASNSPDPVSPISAPSSSGDQSPISTPSASPIDLGASFAETLGALSEQQQALAAQLKAAHLKSEEAAAAKAEDRAARKAPKTLERLRKDGEQNARESYAQMITESVAETLTKNIGDVVSNKMGLKNLIGRMNIAKSGMQEGGVESLPYNEKLTNALKNAASSGRYDILSKYIDNFDKDPNASKIIEGITEELVNASSDMDKFKKQIAAIRGAGLDQYFPTHEGRSVIARSPESLASTRPADSRAAWEAPAVVNPLAVPDFKAASIQAPSFIEERGSPKVSRSRKLRPTSAATKPAAEARRSITESLGGDVIQALSDARQREANKAQKYEAFRARPFAKETPEEKAAIEKALQKLAKMSIVPGYVPISQRSRRSRVLAETAAPYKKIPERVPLSAAQARDVLADMPPLRGNFTPSLGSNIRYSEVSPESSSRSSSAESNSSSGSGRASIDSGVSLDSLRTKSARKGVKFSDVELPDGAAYSLQSGTKAPSKVSILKTAIGASGGRVSLSPAEAAPPSLASSSPVTANVFSPTPPAGSPPINGIRRPNGGRLAPITTKTTPDHS